MQKDSPQNKRQKGEVQSNDAPCSEEVQFQRLQSEFIANISHEIRTPVNVILGYAEMLMEQLEKDQQKQYVQAITTSAQTLISQINDILDLSKVESGTLQLQYEEVNIRKLLHEVFSVFEIYFKQKKLETQLEIDNSVPISIILDERRLRQILVNILNNALKFTNTGFVKISAYLLNKEATADELVQKTNVPSHSFDLIIEIADSGIGIAETQKESIFQVFWQQDGTTTKKYNGLGMGLALSKRLIEIMNGSITVTSHVGKGSIFKVLLHAVKKGEKRDPEPVKAYYQRTECISFGYTTALIVDDSDLDKSLLSDILKQHQILVTHAYNARQAIEILQHFEPHIIFTSLDMPDVSGYDLAFVLKNNKHLGKIPVIAITQELRHQPHHTSIKTYHTTIKKPFHRKEVISVLMNVLPYTVVEQKATKENILEQIEFQTKDHDPTEIKELYKIMQGSLLKEWQHIKQTLIFDEIETFAQKLYVLGEQYQISALQQLGIHLKQQSQDCDIRHLPETLERFSEIAGGITVKVSRLQHSH